MKTHLQSTEAYTCDVYGKDFDREDARNRHMKTHVQSSQTYSCGVCGKEFSRADNRTRHEAVHSYAITCPVCGQFFNRTENMLCHRALHERSEAKQRLPMKRPAAPEPGPSPKHHNLAPLPAKTLMDNPVGPDVFPEDPETRALNRQTAGNPIQDRYNFTLHEMTASTFTEIVPVQTVDNSFQD